MFFTADTLMHELSPARALSVRNEKKAGRAKLAQPGQSPTF